MARGFSAKEKPRVLFIGSKWTIVLLRRDRLHKEVDAVWLAYIQLAWDMQPGELL